MTPNYFVKCDKCDFLERLQRRHYSELKENPLMCIRFVCNRCFTPKLICSDDVILKEETESNW